jgi:hypothetical protein
VVKVVTPGEAKLNRARGERPLRQKASHPLVPLPSTTNNACAICAAASPNACVSSPSACVGDTSPSARAACGPSRDDPTRGDVRGRVLFRDRHHGHP